MSNTMNRAALAAAAALVRPAIANQPYVPALTHIHLDGKRATAYDDKLAISVPCTADVKRLVPGELLIKALASFGGAEVLFQQVDDQHMKLTSGRAYVKLPTLPLEQFPFKWPDDPETVEVDLDDELVRGIERCLISVGNDSNRPAQMGVTLDHDADNLAVLYSTDNGTISRFTTDVKVKLPGDAPVIMPRAFCEQVVALVKAFPTTPKEAPFIELRSDCLVAYIGEAWVFSRLPVDTTPEDFPLAFARHVKDLKSLRDIPDTLDAALGRAALVLAGEVVKKTTMTVDKRGLRLKSTSTAGDADDACDGEVLGGGQQVQVDPSLLARAAKVTAQMMVTDRVTVFADKTAQFVHIVAHVE